MAARNQNVTVTQAAFVALSDGDVSSLTIQNQGGYPIKVTAAASKPSPGAPGLILYPNLGQQSLDVATAFPHVGAASTVWAQAVTYEDSTVYVSHA